VVDEVMKQLGAKAPVAILGFTSKRLGRQNSRPSIGSSRPWAKPRRSWPRPNPSAAARASHRGERSKGRSRIYRQRYGEGNVRRSIAEEEADARALYGVLAEVGGPSSWARARARCGTFCRRRIRRGIAAPLARADARGPGLWRAVAGPRMLPDRNRSHSWSSASAVGALAFNLGTTLLRVAVSIHPRHGLGSSSAS